MHELNNSWTMWIHYPYDNNWGINSYKKITNFSTLEDSIMLIENINKELIEKSMMFFMKENIKPLWEDSNNINGGFNNSWHQALKTISLYTKYLPKKNSFASLGCVLQPHNIGDIEDVIRFGTKISWFTSLVPIHVTNQSKPRGFQSFDQNLRFNIDEYKIVDELIEKVRKMKNNGFLLYDSDQYLDDIKRFVKGEKVTWRKKNKNICDSPNLYFALLPNAEVAPCCDFRIDKSYPAYAKNFPDQYYSKTFRKEIKKVTKACDGCMYGSYPEMSIAMRFMRAKIQRLGNFFSNPPEKNWPLSYEEILDIATEIRLENRSRLKSREVIFS